MTKPEKRRCAWCGAAFEGKAGPGRPRRYCKRSHRQRHYESRTVAEQRGIREDELLVERSKVEHLHDLMYILETACEDALVDLESDAGDVAAYRAALLYVLESAAPLRDAHLEPKADLHG